MVFHNCSFHDFRLGHVKWLGFSSKGKQFAARQGRFGVQWWRGKHLKVDLEFTEQPVLSHK